ncbi:MAG: hypothetical protein R3F65_15320 [bacterium]
MPSPRDDDLPEPLTADTPLSDYEIPTRLRNILRTRLPVHTAAELAALPVERMLHISGLGASTRPTLKRIVQLTRRRLAGRLAPRVGGTRSLPPTPLGELDGRLPRRERLILDTIGVRTLDVLGQMPRAVLSRIDALGPEAVGRFAALCCDDTALLTLTGLLAALDADRRAAVEIVYGLRDGQPRPARAAALALGMSPAAVEALVDPEALRPLPPMRVLAAAVREALAPVGFAVLPVVAGRIARRLPIGDDPRLEPLGFARLGALLIRPGASAAAAAAIKLVAESDWSAATIDRLCETLRAAHRDESSEDIMGERLVALASEEGHPRVGRDALLVAVAGMCPEVVLTLSPREAPPPPITEPEIQAIVTARLDPLPAIVPLEPTPRAHRVPAPVDTTARLRARMAEVITTRIDAAARAHPITPPAELLAARAAGGLRVLLIRRGPDTVERLAAGLAAHAPVRPISIARALTAGLAAMTDAHSLAARDRADRLGAALDRVLDLDGAAARGEITLAADLSLPLVLGLGDWLGDLARRAATGDAGLVVFAVPGIADADGVLVDRLHRLPGVTPAAVIDLRQTP